VELRIFDVSGASVQRLVRGELDRGPHEIGWDGRDLLGKPLRAGMYLYQLRVDGRVVGSAKGLFLGPRN
jgi:flagellar hook assembly protein FlgD